MTERSTIVPPMPSVETARAGKNPLVVTKLPSGWLMFGRWQFLSGYCVLIADPVVVDLNVLDDRDRAQFLSDMVLVGDALHEVTDSIRINYEILGNVTPVLYAHIFPRYKWEPPEKLKGHEAHYDMKEGPTFDLERDRPLMHAIAEAIDAIKKGAIPQKPSERAWWLRITSTPSPEGWPLTD